MSKPYTHKDAVEYKPLDWTGVYPPEFPVGAVPHHVAIVMDGNGRWARERHMPRPFGHRSGMKAVRAVVEGCLEAGVEWLSLFAFSQENWQRPPHEVSALMSLLEEYIQKEKSHKQLIFVLNKCDLIPTWATV